MAISVNRPGAVVCCLKGHLRLVQTLHLIYKRRVAGELDDIRVNADCPRCGHQFVVQWKTLRLQRTVECQGCGVTIKLEDATPIGAVQRLIDEA